MGVEQFLFFLRGKKFAVNVLNLGGGTALGQGIFVIAVPVITRIFSPEEMGLFGLFVAFVLFVSVGVALRYELAIVSARDDREADYLLAASISFALPTSMLAGLLMMAMIQHDLLSYGTLPLWSSTAMAVMALLFTGVFTALRYWFVRRGNFIGISRALVAQGAGRAVVPIVLGLAQAGWIGLLLGEVAGRVLGVSHMIRAAWPAIKQAIWPIDRAYYASILKRNWKFPMVVLPSSLVEALAVMLPLPIVSYFFGTAAAGQFFLVQRLMSLPAGLIGTSVGDVFHARLAEVHRTEPTQVRLILLRIVKRLAMISCMIYAPIALVSPFIFGFVFGGDWAEAGLLVSILSPLSLVGLVVSPVSRLLLVVNRPEFKLVIDGLRLLVPLLTILVMHHMGYRFKSCMAGFSLLGVLCFLLYLGLVWYASGVGVGGGNRP